MAILIPIFEQIEASITSSLADLKQRTTQVESLLADLTATGIDFDVRVHGCNVSAYADSRASVSFVISLKKTPSESAVRPICERNGSDWYVCSDNQSVLIHVHGVALHMDGLILDRSRKGAA